MQWKTSLVIRICNIRIIHRSLPIFPLEILAPMSIPVPLTKVSKEESSMSQPGSRSCYFSDLGTPSDRSFLSTRVRSRATPTPARIRRAPYTAQAKLPENRSGSGSQQRKHNLWCYKFGPKLVAAYLSDGYLEIPYTISSTFLCL